MRQYLCYIMGLTRRKLITSSALSGAIVGIAGCLSQGSEVTNLGGGNQSLRINFAGNVSTDKPLIKETDLSSDSAYPNYYSALLGSERAADKIQMEYVRQEIPQFVDELEETDFDSEYLVFFGMVLPRSKQLQSGLTTFKNGTLYSEYHIAKRSSDSSEVSINTNIQRIKARNLPNNVEYEVRF